MADKFRVWIDLEEMHGAMMQVMADAVKHSRCILICMSESYYTSPYCQSEAQYAFEKRRVLIPLRVQSSYKADGWLAFLTSCRIYVDFTKMNFDTAYAKVKSEILRSQANRKGSSGIPSRSTAAEAPIMKPRLFSTTSDQLKQFNSGIDQLTDEHTQEYIETGDKLSSVQSTVTSLQKRVELMDTRLERITDSLNWIMKAMARVKMTKEDPPLIEHTKNEQ
ncbi:unnamed protein product [Rotaria sordida]|uniref:TIR domain-containing protein n=1 Tax=Rotaria sordida TaxID=392033 RepID=A0A814GUA4_9BILA|nr:unnamed protein product [Rotaria sordida]